MRQNCGFSGGSRALGAALGGLALAAALAACSAEPRVPIGVTQVSDGVETSTERRARLTDKRAESGDPYFGGAAVADEPSATLIARNVLEQGGNAADAAAALYFGLSVTYPAAAGLGGGGVCLARNAGTRNIDSISFLTRTPRGGGAIAVPGNVRGFALLHARYGKKPWGTVVGPAERLAATGFPASRATARQLADASLVIAASPALARIFGARDGGPAGELDMVTRINLASTLAQVRSQGVNGFYAGQTAHRLVGEAKAAGGALSLEDLRDYRPDVGIAQRFQSGGSYVYLPAASLGAGAFAATLWKNLENAGPERLADAARQTAVALGASSEVDQDFGSTSFAVIDGEGGAVACAVTMNGPFGTGRVAEGTGVVLAASPLNSVKGFGSAFLMPVIAADAGTDRIYFAGAGAGAPKGAASIQHAAKTSVASGDIDGALKDTPADARSPANAIVCVDGRATGACTLGVNPRGHGMGITAVAAGS